MIIDPINELFFLNNQIEEEDSDIKYILILPNTKQILTLDTDNLMLKLI